MALLVYLEPLDTWFFRDARAFGAGESTFAISDIPTGLTLYGALGSQVLARYQVSLHDFAKNTGRVPEQVKEKLGDYDPQLASPKYRLQRPFWTFTSPFGQPELYFSPPANLFGPDEPRGNIRVSLALPEPLGNRKWDLNHAFKNLQPLRLPDPDLQPLIAYLNQNSVRQYLAGNLRILGNGNYRKEEELFGRENRSGNRIEPEAWTVAEQYLFFTQHLRLKDELTGNFYRTAGLAVVAPNLEPDDLRSETLFLGGEKRRARISCQALAGKLVPEDSGVLEAISNEKRFLLYLATPAIFHKGWYREPWPFGDGVRLVAAAVNKPGRLSGWERGGRHAGGKPRPFYRLVPSGSVYFFEAKDWSFEQFQEMYQRFHCGESLSEVYPAAGLGIALVGIW